MKKVIIALTVIIAMASCKKENVTTTAAPDPQPGGVVKSTRVKSIVTTSNAGYPTRNEKITYDASGRVTSYTRDETAETFNYLSPVELVITRRKTSDNSILLTMKCTLNDKGAITQMVEKNPSNVTTRIETREYTTEGYLKYVKQDDGVTVYEDIYTIVNGNVTNKKLTKDGGPFLSVDYTTNPLIKNSLPYNFVTTGWPLPLLNGKPLKNAIIEAKTYRADGILFQHNVFSYQLNAVDDIIKITTDYQSQAVKNVSDFILE